MPQVKVTPDAIKAMKGATPIASLTAYDFPTAKLLDEAGVPLLLVGDSVGMVMLGFPDTTHVTLDHILHHTRAAARAQPKALLAADLPFGAAASPQKAAEAAKRLVDAGAEAVKLEGGDDALDAIHAIRAAGIPVMGHLGMLPQRVLEEGGYSMKGKTDADRDRLIREAIALSDAGVFAIVLELVKPNAARAVTQACAAPTIGIGSGPHCDGQILVTHDLFGLFPWFTPRFVKPRLSCAENMRQAVLDWMNDMGSDFESSAQKRAQTLSQS